VVEDGAISVSVGEVSFTKGVAYPVLVRHTRKGESRDLLLPVQAPGGAGASLIPLFSSSEPVALYCRHPIKLAHNCHMQLRPLSVRCS